MEWLKPIFPLQVTLKAASLIFLSTVRSLAILETLSDLFQVVRIYIANECLLPYVVIRWL